MIAQYSREELMKMNNQELRVFAKTHLRSLEDWKVWAEEGDSFAATALERAEEALPRLYELLELRGVIV